MKARYRKAKEGMSSSTKSVFVALIGDLLVAACKTVAAVWTGSAAMMSEAIHSFVDTTNEVLLLYGIHRSRQKGKKPMPIIPSDMVVRSIFGALSYRCSSSRWVPAFPSTRVSAAF